MNLENALALEHATRAITLAAGQPSPFLVMALGNRSFGQSVPASLPGANPRLAFDARTAAEGAVAMARAGMPQVWRASAAFNFAMVETNLGNIDAAALCYERLAQSSRQGEATALYRANALARLAVTQHLLGHNDAALRTRRGAGDDAGRGDGLCAGRAGLIPAGHGLKFPSTATAQHAAVRVEAHDRKRLEQLCRYITRPALADERVQLNATGQVELKLKALSRDGTTHLVMSPLELCSDWPRWRLDCL